jgi:hypothetical protein
VFISMLEEYKKSGNLNVQCKKKKKKTKEKKAKESKEEREERRALEKEYAKRVKEQDLEFKTKSWESNMSRVAALFQNQIELNIESDNLMPFDFATVATSDQEFDAQKDLVVEKIQHLLASKKPDDSIALFREARCLWPMDQTLFGKSNMSADDEFEAYKNLIMQVVDIKKPDMPKKRTAPSIFTEFNF